MEFALNIAINRTSIGNVGYCISKEIFEKGLNPVIFPITEIDLKSFSPSEEYKVWLNENINRGLSSHKRDNPTFKVWHISDHQSHSRDEVLYTFHECDQATPTEVNIVNNKEKVIFPSEYNCDVFRTFGANNVSCIPLGFDSSSFNRIDKKYHPDDVIVFGLFGKMEFRKNHHKVLNLWAKKYGNNKNYQLNCALFNPFMKPEHQQAFLHKALDGKRYWNINFLPYMEGNNIFNDCLNSIDIVLDFSSGESWSLPSFQAVGIGKHGVVMNAHGIKMWADNDNCVLVKPSGKKPMYDNFFFKEGLSFNQGNGFDFSDEDFYSGIEQGIIRFKSNRVNENGFKLQEKFSYKNTVESILKELEELN